MLTREQIQEHLKLEKRAVRDVAIELIADSHITALDEIDRLEAELAERNSEIMRIYRDMAKINGGSYQEGHIRGRFYDDLAKPQGNTTGNLLIPRREEGSDKE